MGCDLGWGWRLWLCAACAGGLLACSPVFNWREVRVGDAALLALLPCKPDKAERQVPMQGKDVTLHMASCEVGQTTFALSVLRLPEGLDATAAAQAWKLATLASLKATPDSARDWAVPPRSGVAPVGWRASGVRHTGQPVEARVLSLARGQDLYQLAVYGDVPPDVLTTLVDGLRFAPGP